MSGDAEVRGNELYVWQEQESDGSWGTIAAVVPGLRMGITPLDEALMIEFRHRRAARRERVIQSLAAALLLGEKVTVVCPDEREAKALMAEARKVADEMRP